ncbi:MAG: ABC-F family ATP-binding cassette domain-containing protein [Deltaproteobacteria bacterium]|nr:ABC-F family ATP-binding cassette domain-containing protein [Deltaproteobacteria bacterium]
MLVSLDSVGFAYAGDAILTDATLQLDPGDRLGLIGRNGTGKTTLLKLLSGELQPESGRTHRTPSLRVAVLRQTQDALTAPTVLDAALEPLADVIQLEDEIARVTEAMAHDASLAEKYGHLQDTFERRGGYSAPARAKKIISGLGFVDADHAKPTATLSGGEKNRLALARLLLTDAQLLLLDEPTNHLDLEATEFLEEFLTGDRSGRDRAMVVVSHDRRFLDRVATRTALLENTRIRVFPGGYTRAMAMRAEQRELELAAFEQQQEHIARTEDFIRRNIAGQNTKQAQSRRTQLEKLERLEKPTDEGQAARIRLPPVQQSEREVLAAKELSLRIGERTLLSGASFVLERGEKVGLVGPNGSGKSTLLRALVGEAAPASGSVRMGGRVKLGYYDQELRTVDARHNVLEELRLTGKSTSDGFLRGWAGRFLFSGEEALRPLSTMSGGERARAALAKLTLSGANFLVLDEPTNHLDAASREALEAALEEYDGTLLCVSHDRLFLDRVTTRTLWLHEQKLEDYRYPFSEARLRHQAATAQVSGPAAAPSAAQLSYDEQKARDREQQKKKRRAAAIDEELKKLEAELERLEQALAAETSADAWEKLAGLHQEKNAAEERMLALMEEREGLGA